MHWIYHTLPEYETKDKTGITSQEAYQTCFSLTAWIQKQDAVRLKARIRQMSVQLRYNIRA